MSSWGLNLFVLFGGLSSENPYGSSWGYFICIIWIENKKRSIATS